MEWQNTSVMDKYWHSGNYLTFLFDLQFLESPPCASLIFQDRKLFLCVLELCVEKVYKNILAHLMMYINIIANCWTCHFQQTCPESHL